MPRTYVDDHAERRGIKIMEARSHVTIVVSNEDVVLAKKADSRECAAVRASLRVPGVIGAFFFRSMAYLEFDNRLVRFRLPPSLQKEIVSFDRSQIFAPGVYRLSPPDCTRPMQRKRSTVAREKKLRRANRPPLADAIDTIVLKESPAADTPEQRAFESQIASIMGNRKPVKKRRAEPQPRVLVRSKYVRDAKDPRRK